MPSEENIDSRFSLLPTNEELDHLRETKNLFRSNLLHLELEELLANTHATVSEKLQTRVKEYLVQLKEFLEGLKPKAELKFSSIAKSINIANSFDEELQLDFSAPESINVVGSFVLDTMLKKNKNIDITFRIPAKCFDDKDFMNRRYLIKRAIYVKQLAKLLSSKKDLCLDVSFRRFAGDDEKPIITFTIPSTVGIKGFCVRLIPSIDASVFPLRRFGPKFNNLQGLRAPSPYYNMAVLEDISVASSEAHLKLFSSVQDLSKSFGDLCVVLKVWAKLRGFCNQESPDSFNDTMLIMLAAILILKKRINAHMSVQQMFKSVIEYVAASDFLNHSIRLKDEEVEGTCLRLLFKYSDDVRGNFVCIKSEDSLICCIGFDDETMFGAFPVVLILEDQRLNVAWRVSKSGYLAVKEQAAMSHAMLENETSSVMGGRDLFETIFATKLDYWYMYDKYFAIRVPPRDEKKLVDGTWSAYLRTHAQGMFEKAFLETGRATNIRVIEQVPATEWGVSSTQPESSVFLIAMQLDTAQAFRLLDKGPSADDEDAALAFRSFWGDKSELRRFNDGSIVETLDWTDSKDVLSDIACLVLGRHAPFDSVKQATNISVGHPLETMVNRYSPNTELQSQVISAYDLLASRVRQLSLPLQVTNVRALAPCLRYASVKAVRPHPLAFGNLQNVESRKRKRETTASRFVDAIPVVLHLESSGKWPEDLSAIAKMKTAMYAEIAEQFEKSFKGQQRCQVAEDFVDVLFNGFAFRVMLRVDYELTLIKGGTSQRSSVSKQVAASMHQDDSEKNDFIPAWYDFSYDVERRLVREPLLHLQLHALHTMSTADGGGARVMGPVTVLAKRWIAGHYFWSDISEQAVEIIVASLFLHPQPYSAPRSPIVGFLRFLQFLATWDWQGSPLVVDLGKQFTDEKRSSITKRFNEARDRAGGAPMYIVTPEDENDGHWTPTWTSMDKPDTKALSRLVQCAENSQKLLLYLLAQESLAIDGDVDESLWQALFCSLPRDLGFYCSIDLFNEDVQVPVLKNLDQKVVVGVNMTSNFCEYLTRVYGHLASFTCDPVNGGLIGMTWKTDIMKPVPLRVAVAGHARPLKDGKVAPNAVEILSDIVTVAGKQTVRSITIL